MLNLLSIFQEQVKNNGEKRRWWLFNAIDFQSLMYPCFIFCRILGVFPYKVNALSFEASKLCYILSTIITCVSCCCTLILICMADSSGRPDDDIRRTIEFNLFYLSGSFVVIITLVLSAQRMRLLQIILKISSRLPSKIYHKQSIFIHTKDIISFLFLFIYTLTSFYNSQTFPDFVWSMPSTLYNTLVMFQMDMLYINCVCVLKACFKAINDDLANLLIVYDKPHLVRFFCHKQRNLLLLLELKALKKQHLMVSDSVQMLNVIFSPQLLTSFTLSFIHVSVELYKNVVKWQNGWSISWTDNEQINRPVIMTYVVCHFIKIALIAWACETGKNQATKIRTTVHDVLNSTNDEQIKHELKSFSLQIMHCNNAFYAKGLTLDATLLPTMMDIITTYILISIQFLITSHSCDKRTAIDVKQTI